MENKTIKTINGPLVFNPMALNPYVSNPPIQQNESIETEKELLIDCISFSFAKDNLFEEAIQNPNKRLIVKGILQRAGMKNQNGRIYPLATLQKQANLYNENFIKQRRALGELDHPNEPIVNLKNVSHNIVEMYWNGNDLMGVIEILPTPSGRILKDLFASGINLGISSRGLGSVKKENLGEGSVDVVADDYELLSFDFVSNPSTQGAFMRPVGRIPMNESVIPMATMPIVNAIETANIIKKQVREDAYNNLLSTTKSWIERNPRYRSPSDIACGRA